MAPWLNPALPCSALLSDASAALQSRLDSTVSFRSISIWFKNNDCNLLLHRVLPRVLVAWICKHIRSIAFRNTGWGLLFYDRLSREIQSSLINIHEYVITAIYVSIPSQSPTGFHTAACCLTVWHPKLWSVNVALLCSWKTTPGVS